MKRRGSHHQPNQFENIFICSKIEVANEEMRNWRDCFNFVNKVTKGKQSLSEMTKVLQKELLKSDKGINPDEAEFSTYYKVQIGLFYKIMTCEERNIQDLFSLVQLLNQDHFSCFIAKVSVVLYCLYKIKEKYMIRMVKVLSYLIEICMDKLEGILVSFLRNVYFVEKVSKNLTFITEFFELIDSKKDLIAQKCPDALVPIFFKSARLTGTTVLFKECSPLQTVMINVMKFIWTNHKKRVFTLGRELIRAFQELFTIKELEFLTKELNSDYEGDKLYRRLLRNEFKESKLNTSNLILVQIPPLLDEYTTYIVNSASKFNFNRHLGWMMKKVGIEQNTIAESVLVDYVRYLLIRVEDNGGQAQPSSSEGVYRWLILGNIMKRLSSQVYSKLAKQALFFDWLYYSGNAREYHYFEPTWLLILNSLSKYKDLSEELLDFLFLYAKDYDMGNEKIEQNVAGVFGLFQRKQLGMLLKSDELNPHLRNRLQTFVSSSKLSTKPSGKSSTRKGEKMSLESGYNPEVHQGGYRIFEREKPYRINARGIVLEKMGDSVPLFIRELKAFAEFRNLASFKNLSTLLDDIFAKGFSLANQTYSPTMIDQLSQDQVIRDTAQFMGTLFEEFLKSPLQLHDCKNFDQVFTKVLSKNFDYEKEFPMLMGLSFFLFAKLSRVFSEDLNKYYIMEKLMGQIFENSPIVHFEFIALLSMMKFHEKDPKAVRAVGTTYILTDLKLERMGEIFFRCCSHIVGIQELVSNTLKFMYMNLGQELLLELVDTYSELLSKADGENVKHIIMFLLRIFNKRLAFRLALSHNLRLLVPYKANIKPLMNGCLSKNLAMQNNFWTLHGIIVQQEPDGMLETTCEAFKDVLNNVTSLSKKKTELAAFLWGFRDHFMTRFYQVDDEKTMINCLASILALRSHLDDFVFLVFKNLKDKVIQKSLRIFLKSVSEDHEAIINLTEHLYYWKKMNFTKVGNDQKKFSLDFLILKQLDTCIDELGLDKHNINRLH